MVLRLALLSLCGAAAAGDAVVERFQAYLRLPTAQPTPDYPAAAAFLAQQAAEVGLSYETLTVEAGKPIVLMTWPGTDTSLPSILLNSHTDVVPAEDAFWSHPPFGAELHNGRVYARGSQDMKCVGMQYLEALRRLKAAGWAPLRTLVVSWVPDEARPHASSCFP
jgi:aminoacylase